MKVKMSKVFLVVFVFSLFSLAACKSKKTVVNTQKSKTHKVELKSDENKVIIKKK